MMKKIFSLMLLCTALVIASCGNDDDTTPVTVSGVPLDKTTLSIAVGKTGTLKATVAPEDATDKSVTWSSDKTDVATVKDGVVTAVAEGTANITATSVADNTKKATCVVTVGITWAKGNLVADGANGAKIGTATDGSLYFQFGSLIGWSTTGSPTVVVSPVGYTGSNTWNGDWTGDPATENVATGTGDPCRYYLKGTWRLPTKDEYEALFNNVTDLSYANSGGWSWDATTKSATHSTKNLSFAALSYRYYTNGILNMNDFGRYGAYWSASYDADKGYYLGFTSTSLMPSTNSRRADGNPIRCVQEE